MQTPVVLIIYRRPDTTRKVFNVVRDLKPRRLFIIADGPHDDEDRKRCQAARSVVEEIDWDCTVMRNYADINMGCQKRISSGLDWVFEEAERAIILEDDCVPDPSFFAYCDELLDRYAKDSHVMTISGNNYQPRRRTSYSYYFSRYMHCWGWATWRRAWKHFDVTMKTWPKVRDQRLLTEILGKPSAASYWENIFEKVYSGEVDSWAYIWQYNIWMRSGLNILPEVNLVKNIGFGRGATHTENENNIEYVAQNIEQPIRHPPVIVRHRSADDYTQNYHYQRSILQRVLGKLPRWIKA